MSDCKVYTYINEQLTIISGQVLCSVPGHNLKVVELENGDVALFENEIREVDNEEI